jgi:hypothetical protein
MPSRRESPLWDEMVREFERKKQSGIRGQFRVEIHERSRATPRADIWIHRATGSVCREKRLTKRALLKDIAADFTFLRFLSY